MAVATDSHRDFLAPERAYCGTPDNQQMDDLRLFFCFLHYIIKSAKINRGPDIFSGKMGRIFICAKKRLASPGEPQPVKKPRFDFRNGVK